MKSEKKQCKKCKRLLPTEDFPLDKRSPDGLWRFCRECESARKKELRQRHKADKPDKGKTLKTYLRTKASYRQRNLGHFFYVANKLDNKIKREYISVFLPRMWRTFKRYKGQISGFNWDDLFSEVISHEIIHYALMHIDKNVVESAHITSSFDNIAGRCDPYHPETMGTGLQ